jgi:CobQ-like glutamine amidotransferase family enzyme
MILLFGASGSIMASELRRSDGITIEGLSYLDMECQERKTIYGDDIHFRTLLEPSLEIIGCQIHMLDIKLNGVAPLGKLLYGRGNSEKNTTDEGAKYKNMIFTNALGPLLVKNPWYCETLIKEAMLQKGVNIAKSIDPQEYALELNSLVCIKEFIKKKPR